jgi:hypothetical protein
MIVKWIEGYPHSNGFVFHTVISKIYFINI